MGIPNLEDKFMGWSVNLEGELAKSSLPAVSARLNAFMIIMTEKMIPSDKQ